MTIEAEEVKQEVRMLAEKVDVKPKKIIMGRISYFTSKLKLNPLSPPCIRYFDDSAPLQASLPKTLRN